MPPNLAWRPSAGSAVWAGRCEMFASRESDERILEAIRLKRERLPWKEIARRTKAKNHVAMQGACLAVKAADIEESGEPKSRVWSAYW